MWCPLSRSSNEAAILYQDQVLTYNVCNRLVAGMCASLPRQGVVAFQPNLDPASILLFFACARKGLIAFPLSERLTKSQVEAVLARTCATFITPKLCDPEKPGSCQIDLHAHATYMLTSGSTAAPKIAIHSFANHITSALGVTSYFSLRATDSWQLCLPLYHVSGLAILWRCFLTGAAVSIDAPFTHTSLVPTQLARYAPTCKAILVGGASLPTALALKYSHLPLYPSYGLTEMSSTVLIKNQPLPYRRVKIIDQELFVSGPTLFKGYLNEEPPTEWFGTRDLVSPSYEIIGRKDRMFISGGENIYPEVIERALTQLPHITAAHVVAVSDPEFGKRPVAFIESNTYYSLNELRAALDPLLPRFQHPIAAFPLNADSGLKVNLQALEAQAIELTQSLYY
ncbi:MAG: AMP-binding protein [Chlamydiales bacterium]|nr:AMP-binding protein [Chlamydiales bacterium]